MFIRYVWSIILLYVGFIFLGALLGLFIGLLLFPILFVGIIFIGIGIGISIAMIINAFILLNRRYNSC